MHNGQTIFVTGATGRQGTATVEALISKGFNIKALTRDPASAAAKKLETAGANIVKGDLNDPASYRDQLKDIYGICCILTYENGTDKEIKQGIELVKLAKENNISHFVYSSVIGCDLNTNIPHWDSKAVIEKEIKDADLPFTIVRPASLLENNLIPQVKSRILKGKLPSPVNKNVKQQFIACKDVGRIIAAVFSDPGKYFGKTFNIAADEMNLEQLAAIFTQEMGKPVSFQKMPGLITRLVMGKNLYKMFKWINENDALFVKDLPAFKNEYPGLVSCRDWVKQNFAATA